MDRGAWQATVLGVSRSRTRLNDFTSLRLVVLAHGLAVPPHVVSGTKPVSPALAGGFLATGPQGSPTLVVSTAIIILNKFHVTLVSPASSILGEWGNTSSSLILNS